MAGNVIIRILGEYQAKQAIKEAEKDITKLGSTAEKASKEGSKGSADFTKSLKGLAVTAGVVGGALATFGIAAKKAFEMGKQGAMIQQTTESFDGLLERLNIAPGYLESLREASNNTIDDMSLMSSTLTLVAGSSDEMAKAMLTAAPQLLEIAKAANKLNPALGTTSFMYESIMTGIKRSSPLILDNLGLTLKVGEANETYAAALGKTVEQLTAEEQKMALLNATLQAGDQLIEQVGGSTESGTDSIAQMDAALTNLGNSFKLLFAPAVTGAAGAIADVAESLYSANDAARMLRDALDNNQISQDKFTQLMHDMNFNVITADEAIRRLNIAIGENEAAYMRANWASEEFRMALARTNWDEYRQQAQEASASTELFKNKVDALGGPLSDSAYMVDNLHDKMRTAGIGIRDAAGALDLVAENASKAKSNLERLNNINLNFGSEIRRQLEQLEYRGIGGEDFQLSVKAVMEDPQIPDSVRSKYLTEAEKIEAALQVDAGNLGIDEAARRIAEDMGGSAEEVQKNFEDVKGEIENIQALLTAMSARDYWLDFVLNITTRTSTTGNTGGGGGGGGGGGTGGRKPQQAGDFGFTVPAGYNNDSFLMGLTSGEQVDVTTRSGSQGGKQAQKGAQYNYEFNISTNDPLAVANEVIAIINSQQRAATVAGAGYTGL